MNENGNRFLQRLIEYFDHMILLQRCQHYDLSSDWLKPEHSLHLKIYTLPYFLNNSLVNSRPHVLHNHPSESSLYRAYDPILPYLLNSHSTVFRILVNDLLNVDDWFVESDPFVLGSDSISRHNVVVLGLISPVFKCLPSMNVIEDIASSVSLNQ